MGSNKTIQKLAAGLMLLLFALSITPKQLLHDVISGHTHSYSIFDADADVRITKSGFQCNWQNQPVQSPFEDQPDFELQHPIIIHSSLLFYYTLSADTPERSHSSLRGPPAQA